MSGSQMDGLKEAVKVPKRFFRRANAEPEKYLAGALAITLLPAAFSFSDVLSEGSLTLLPLYRVSLSIIRLLLLSFLAFVIGRRLGGQGRLLSLLVCLGYAGFPSILMAGISTLFMLLLPPSLRQGVTPEQVQQLGNSMALLLSASLLPLMFLSFWLFSLYTLACRECNRTGSWTSVFTAFVSWFISNYIVYVLSVKVVP